MVVATSPANSTRSLRRVRPRCFPEATLILCTSGTHSFTLLYRTLPCFGGGFALHPVLALVVCTINSAPSLPRCFVLTFPGFLVSELGMGPTEMPRADVRFGCVAPEGADMLANMVRVSTCFRVREAR